MTQVTGLKTASSRHDGSNYTVRAGVVYDLPDALAAKLTEGGVVEAGDTTRSRQGAGANKIDEGPRRKTVSKQRKRTLGKPSEEAGSVSVGDRDPDDRPHTLGRPAEVEYSVSVGDRDEDDRPHTLGQPSEEADTVSVGERESGGTVDETEEPLDLTEQQSGVDDVSSDEDGELPDGVVDLGGGWYTVNGETIRGRDAAVAAAG